MKKKLFTFFTAFIFAFVAVGAWDCGCAFAAMEQKPTSSPPQEKVMKCHGEASGQTKSQEKETCCPGCQLEKAHNNSFSSIEAVQLTNQKAFTIKNQSLKAFVSLSNEIQQKKSTFLQAVEGRSASVHVSNPIYLIVQSFLI